MVPQVIAWILRLAFYFGPVAVLVMGGLAWLMLEAETVFKGVFSLSLIALGLGFWLLGLVLYMVFAKDGD